VGTRVESHGSAGENTRLLARAANAVDRRISDALTTEHLSADQWRVLDVLSKTDQCTMSELADAVGTSSATLTRIIDRLVTRALVYRTADDADRRRVLVQLSQRGAQMVIDLRPEVERAEACLLANLTALERDQLTALLARVTGGMH